MGQKLVDVEMHIDEDMDEQTREKLRGNLLEADGVEAAAISKDQPHMVMIEYDPNLINSKKFVDIAVEQGLHAELVGM